MLIDRHLTAKLGDFGCSQEFSQVVGGQSFVTAAVVAKSLGYSAPEVDTCRVSPKSDVYAYGEVSFYIFCNQCSKAEDSFAYVFNRPRHGPVCYFKHQ